ncbi:hypothetical protein T03_29 [Trichinella britovi]|uniref:Uncharacterized protein n=1 Tax=Trichinella britovi TaxID=45882 RepID=A0A0V1CD39_TRIBR|nr:hypothetical protein T03_29 [Trichinella britovi]
MFGTGRTSAPDHLNDVGSTNWQATRFFHQHIWPSEQEKLEASDLQIMNTMASAAKTSSKKLTALKDQMNWL